MFVGEARAPDVGRDMPSSMSRRLVWRDGSAHPAIASKTVTTNTVASKTTTSPPIAEPGGADRGDRARRSSGPDDGQPGLPARPGPRTGHRPVALQALDLLRAAVEGRAARRDAARPLDRAVLPRRGNRAGGRPPAVCVLPAGRLPRVRVRLGRRGRAAARRAPTGGRDGRGAAR